MSGSPSGPDEGPPLFTPARAFGWVLIAFALMVTAAGLMVSAHPDLAEDIVTLGAISSAIFLLTSGLLLGRYPSGDRLSSALGLRGTSPVLVALGLVIGVVAQLPADRLRRVIEIWFPLTEAQQAARAAFLVPSGPSHGVAIVVVAALLVPFAEEAFFRGALFGALRRAGQSASIAAIITSLGFTLSHFDQRMWLPIAFVAALLGLVRAASGSLWPSLMLHVGFNGLSALASVLSPASLDVETFPLRLELWAWGILAVLVALFVLICRTRVPRASRRADEVVGG